MRLSSYIISILVLLSVSIQVTNAQEEDAFPKLNEIKGKKLQEKIRPLQNKKGLWGYADDEDKFIIRPVFTDACPFEANLARISVNGKWGTISNVGLYVLLPQYDRIEQYSSDSLAIAKDGKSFYLINAKGHVVTENAYDSLAYSDYGYHAYQQGKIGTISNTGKLILEPQYEIVNPLDRQNGIEQIRMNGKWGVLKDGMTLLSHKWDKELKFFQAGGTGQVDLYLAYMGGKYGVVTVYGDFVVPCVYDEISMASSGRYYITRQGEYFGALSLKMTEIVPPVLDSKPFIGDDLYRVCDAGKYYGANVNGSVPFKDCASLYQMFKPEEYKTTNSIPEWSKTSIIEENLQERQKSIDQARMLSSLFKQSTSDLSSYLTNSSLPVGYDPFIAVSDVEKYGIMTGGTFSRSETVLSNTEKGNVNVLYCSGNEALDNASMLQSSQGEYLMCIEGDFYSLDKSFGKFNLKKPSGVSPIDYSFMPNDRVMVRFLLNDSAEAYGQSENATHVIMVFSTDSLAIQSCSIMPVAEPHRLIGSAFGGFYSYSSQSVIDTKNPLKRYDNNGIMDWTFVPKYGESFYDIEETEDFIYLSGAVAGGNGENPIVLQLDKRGRRVQDLVGDYNGSRFDGIVCKDYLMYLKITNGRNSPGKDYYPLYLLEDLNDNFGVHLSCVWEDWGGGKLGGCGLVGLDGKWLESPVLSQDQMCTSFEREFSSFTSDYLVIRHRGSYGLLDRNGVVKIDPKYDKLEPLDNPYYFKAMSGDVYGVVDADGKVVVPIKYESVGNMKEDMIVVGDGFKYGCYDRDGKMIVPLQYDEIEEFAEGLARIKYMKWYGFIDQKGEICIPTFSDEARNCSEGLMSVTVMNKKGFVSRNGYWVSPPIYDDAGSYSGGYAYVSSKGKYGYIDASGNMVIPAMYSKAKSFDDKLGLACVEMNGKWGVIDKEGKSIMQNEYDMLHISADGYILVEKDGKFGIFSKEGKSICPVSFDVINLENECLFKNDVASARLIGQRVRIDIQGNVVYMYSLLTQQ